MKDKPWGFIIVTAAVWLLAGWNIRGIYDEAIYEEPELASFDCRPTCKATCNRAIHSLEELLKQCQGRLHNTLNRAEDDDLYQKVDSILKVHNGQGDVP